MVSVDLSQQYKVLSAIKFQEQDIVFVAGSLIEGVGNPLSDLDFYVVCQEVPAGIAYPAEQVEMIETEDGVVDVNFVTHQQLQRYIERLQQVPRINAVGLFGDREKRFIYRFMNGQGIVNRAAYELLKQEFHHENFKMSMIQDVEMRYRDKRKDVLGNLMAEKIETAYIVWLELLRLSMQLTLLSFGETHANEKWRYEKLKQINPKWAVRYWEIQTKSVTKLEDVKRLLDWLDRRHEDLFPQIEMYLPESRIGQPYAGV